MKGATLKIIPKFGNEANMASDVLKAMLSRIRHVTKELEAQEAQVELLDWQKYVLIYRFRRRPATMKPITVGGDRHRTSNNAANASASNGIPQACRVRFTPNIRTIDQLGRGTLDLGTAQVQVRPADLSTAQVPETPGDLSTAQVPALKALSETQRKIVAFCDVPRRLAEIMEHLSIVNRGYFKKRRLAPLLRAGVMAMTNPDKPRAANQRYVLTDEGARLKMTHLAKNLGGDEDQHGET